MAQPVPASMCGQGTRSGFTRSGSFTSTSTQQAVQAPHSRPGRGWGSIIARTRLENFAVVVLAENFLLGRLVFRNGAAHPRRVHIVLGGDVFADDVAAPGAATQAGGHWHAVGEPAEIG